MAAPYGDVIKRLRTERGWSQQELANMAALHRETVIRAENSHNVGVLNLQQIAAALEADITDFFGGLPVRDEPPKPSWWVRLTDEQRARVERFGYRLLGEREPKESPE